MERVHENIIKKQEKSPWNMKGENHPRYGKKMPDEVRAKISETMRNKKKTKEHKEKISAALKGRVSHRKGKKLPVEHCKNISKGKQNSTYIFTDEHKERISESLKGHSVSEHIIQQLIAYNKSRKGIPKGPDTWEQRIHIKEGMDKYFLYRKAVNKLMLINELKKNYGIDIMNSSYKQWHKPLQEGKSKTHQGYYKPKLNPQKCLTPVNIYRSGWEAKFFDWCDRTPSVIRWATEPIAIQYYHPTANLEYCVEHNLDPNDHRFQKISNYYVDVWIEVRVRENNEDVLKKIFIEIKPYNQSIPPTPLSPNAKLKEAKAYNKQAETYLINKAKWKAARAYCANIGCDFWVCTEKCTFSGPELEVQTPPFPFLK